MSNVYFLLQLASIPNCLCKSNSEGQRGILLCGILSSLLHIYCVSACKHIAANLNDASNTFRFGNVQAYFQSLCHPSTQTSQPSWRNVAKQLSSERGVEFTEAYMKAHSADMFPLESCKLLVSIQLYLIHAYIQAVILDDCT